MKGIMKISQAYSRFCSYVMCVCTLLMVAMVYEGRGSAHAQGSYKKQTIGRPRVTVLVFRSETAAPDQDHLGYLLKSAVTEDLSAVPRVIIADPSQLGRVLGDKKWEPTGSNDSGKIQEIVTFTHADLLVTGSLRGTNGEWAVEVRVHSGSTTIKPTTLKLSGTDLLDIGDQIVLQLLSIVGVVPNVQEIEKIQSKPTSNIAAYGEVARSIIALEQGRVHQAVGYCKKAIELDPSFVLAHFALGNYYAALEQGDLAIASFKEALQLDPAHLCRANMAVVLRKMGRVDDAIREYLEVIKHHPDYPYVQVQLAAAYNAKEDYPKAVAAYKEALRLDPYVPDAHFSLGIVYRQQNQLEEAMAEFHQAIKDYPADAQAYVMLAVVHQLKGAIDESLSVLKEGIKANPSYGKLHNNIAAIYVAKGMYDLAWKHVHEAQRLGFNVSSDILSELRAKYTEPKEGQELEVPAAATVTEIHNASLSGDLVKVKELLEADPNLINAVDDEGRTPLHLAAGSGHNEIVELLLAKGAAINAQKDDGMTPLHGAVGLKQTEVVKLLLDKGADVNVKINNGMTPLHGAAWDGEKVLAELLLTHGGDVNAKANDDLTPLHFAAGKGHKDVVQLLLSKGANVNAKDSDGGTPLHYAALYGFSAVAEILLSHGADVNAKNDEGGTPLYYAVQNSHKEVINVLKRYGGTQ